MDTHGKKANHLINESSPYLLQHAYNPVDWYPWSDEALKKAAEEDKLLVISVGYAACHWCHVMEHESFEDSTVAAIMNEKFVSIKVDREERPDIDQIYMDACHLLTQRGGWPLNAIALPDGRPVYAGTYYPKDNWMQVLNYMAELYKADKPKMLEQAQALTDGINNLENFPVLPKAEFTNDNLNNIFANWQDRIDYSEGGRQGAPKFPMPNNYLYLLKYHHLNQNPKVLEAITVTLDKMAWGGIYDHLGGGFARYSVDGYWHVPHFEKMLYDNGQLMELYALAYQQTKDPLYKQTVYEIHDWVKREMTSDEGGFYSSLDADSEGEEGKFYVWSEEEIDQIVGENAAAFKDYYTIRPGAKWEGHYILHRKMETDKVLKNNDITKDELNKILSTAKTALMAERDKRIRPGLDDKILTSWNALMMKGYLTAYRVFNDEQFLQMAQSNADFIQAKATNSDNRLSRNYKNGKASINAFLDDYALLIDAYLQFYQATFNETWIDKADALTQYTIAHFYDDDAKMFFYTSDEDAALIARKKEVSDNVIPGSNSVMGNNLLMLSKLLDNKEYKEMAVQMLSNLGAMQIEQNGPFYSNWASLMLNLANDPYEVAIVGSDAQLIRQQMDGQYHGNAIYLGGTSEGNLPLLENKMIEGQTTIYVCQNKVCKLPVTSVEKARELMK